VDYLVEINWKSTRNKTCWLWGQVMRFVQEGT